eukprot:TRINITY_DN45602_c0_g1_i1.p1 TRINITY_DN45602_c0_g1~~TRINITY_DN45602_c0_g1_i1.p1  ORF type:complete len:576 (-),score=166.03 TRINITY_DN45602_c0_g1_i1:64-1701(-)
MGTSNIALERVQALLKVDTGNGSLYDHLVKVVRKLNEEKPADALVQLETLSRHLKQATFRGDLSPDPHSAVSPDAAAERLKEDWCAHSMKLARPPSDPLAAPRVLAAVQNYMEDATMFEWAGVGFGKQESFHIAMSLRKLAAETPALASLRLWGKVLGTEADYYVAEATLQTFGAAAPAEPALLSAKQLAARAAELTKTGVYNLETRPPPLVLPGTDYDVECRGQGANTCVYYVSHGGTEPFKPLPAARASMIVAARDIQKLFTGRLDARVDSTPWFPGDEADLLRSQIARISSSCTLAVGGWWKIAEEDPKKLIVDVDDEKGDPVAGFTDLDTLGGWFHAAPLLLNNGRSTYGKDELDAAQGEDTTKVLTDREHEVLSAAWDKEMSFDAAKSMEEVIGSSIEGDQIKYVGDFVLEEPDPDDMAQKLWSVKTCGDKGLYADDAKHSIVAVKSRSWPGAVSVAMVDPKLKKFANLYVGYGLKCGTLVPRHKDSGLPLRGTCPFNPIEPEPVMELYEQNPNPQDEHEEPNPQEKDDDPDPDAEFDDE